MSDTDADDWRLAKDGDTAALARLVETHSDRLFRHASRMLTSREDAKDAVVIAFSELWRKRGSVRTVDGSPLPWLLNTVNNAARNLERSARRYRALLGRIDARPAYTEPAVPDESGVLAALGRLPARQRDVVVLSVLEGYPDGHVAEALGIPIGTMKSRLSRAKAALREDLNEAMEV